MRNGARADRGRAQGARAHSGGGGVYAVGLAPEARLVVAAAVAGATLEALRPLLREDLDWPVVVRLAVRERVAPIVWRAVRGLGEGIPSDAAEALSRLDRIHQFRTAANSGALAEAVRRLSAEGLPVMLLKGAALGHTVYAAPGDRPMEDIDLLLPSERAETGWRVLREAGWRPEREGAESFYDAHHHLLPLVEPRTGQVVVELHRGLADAGTPFELPEAALWRDAEPIEIAGQRAWALSPVHQLYHLCIHFAWSHALKRGLVRTVRDCQALRAGRDLDWDAFVTLALERRAASLCFWTLELARRLSAPIAPEDVLRRLRMECDVRLAEPLARSILAGALPTPRVYPPSVRLARLVWAAAIRPRRHAPGAASPWDAERRAQPGTGTEQRKTAALAGRVLRLGLSAPAWWRYTWQVAAGGRRGGGGDAFA